DLGLADTFCLADGSMQLFPPIPVGGRWSGPGIADAETGLFDPWSIALDGPVTTVEVSYTFANGSCEVTETKNVSVIDMRFVDGGPQVNVCISEEKILLTGGFPAGGWYEGPGVDSGGYFGLQGLTAGDYILTYNYQLPLTACIGSDTFVVSIRPLPIPDFNFVDSLCLGVESRYSGAGSGGNTYEWLFDDGASYTGKEVNHAFTTTGPHEILMLAYSIYGCLDSIRKEVFVSGPPEVAFVKDTTQGCAVLPVNFTNQTIGYQNVRYAWDFGNGQKSTDEQPATVFYQQGLQDTTYFIALVAKNHCGEDSGLDSILVFPKPLSDAKISQDYGCTPLSIRFNNLTKGLPDEFAWYVNGTFLSSDSIPPDQVFRASGPDNANYSIQLVSTNECGVDTSTRELIVSPDSIRAFFTADATIGCEPFRVNFKNYTAPDSIVVYNWFFDQNDDTSNAIDTSYTFYATGDTITRYKVRLEADNGCSRNFFEVMITVNPAPKVAFETLSAVCAKDSIAFFNRSIDVSGHLWEFGDGLSSPATNPVHQFETPGRYKVRLTSYAAGTGCPGTYEQSVLVRPLPKPAFSVDKSFGCPPLQVSLNNQTPDASRYYYRWAFGDGNTAVGQGPSPHRYMDSGSFYINLSASDEFGCTGDTLLAQEISVFPVPQPDFAFLPEADCGLPMKVGIDNLTSGASGYRWSFGNGSQESVENNPSTTYLEEGRYQVSVEAKNEFLCAATLVKSIDIYERPLADFSLSKNDWCEEEWIRPENLSLHADRFEWQIGSLRDTSRNPVFAFSNSGIYDLSLIAGNGSGCRDTLQLKNLIEVFPRPTAAFSYLYLDQEAPSTFLFEDQSSEDAVALYWDFGDGKTVEGVSNPVHRYLSSFDKTVVLEVSNEFGCQDTMTQVVDLDTLGGLYIPNILEPDNPTSGKQIFQPVGIGLSEYHIAIYTRNGQMIWESEALNEEGQPTGSWDGTFGGNPLPAGVYVWKVRHARYFNGAFWSGMNDESGKARRTGFVYLVR
ncbi:MAG: PKD domain-containing protein, partial [Saprospiraceae bacterium]|nr:PKD domain-containing protein [Saprospiraceae bacterium]